jgi:hypothetical protein
MKQLSSAVKNPTKVISQALIFDVKYIAMQATLYGLKRLYN